MIIVYKNKDIEIKLSEGEFIESLLACSTKSKTEVLMQLLYDGDDISEVAENISKQLQKDAKGQIKASKISSPKDMEYHKECAELFKKRAEAWKQISEVYK